VSLLAEGCLEKSDCQPARLTPILPRPPDIAGVSTSRAGQSQSHSFALRDSKRIRKWKEHLSPRRIRVARPIAQNQSLGQLQIEPSRNTVHRSRSVNPDCKDLIKQITLGLLEVDCLECPGLGEQRLRLYRPDVRAIQHHLPEQPQIQTAQLITIVLKSLKKLLLNDPMSSTFCRSYALDFSSAKVKVFPPGTDLAMWGYATHR